MIINSRLTFVILALFAGLFSVVLDSNRQLVQSLDHYPEWQQAQWIEFPGSSEILYARKRFNLESTPSWAYLVISAVDNFEVYVNNNAIGGKTYVGGRPTAIFDISTSMKIGTNLIAIRSASQSRGMSGQVLVKVYWKNLGQENSLLSGNDWRVENRELSQRQGLLAWNKLEFDDGSWSSAVPIFSSMGDTSRPLSISVEALGHLRARNWLWQTNAKNKQDFFFRLVKVDSSEINAAWMGVSVEGAYQLTINDFIFAKRIATQDKMDVFSIAPYLEHGSNRIGVQIYTKENTPHRVAISGFVSDSKKGIDFSADQYWKCGDSACNVVGLSPLQIPRLNISHLIPPPTYTLERWKKRSVLFITIFFSTLIFGSFTIPLFKACGFTFPHVCMLYQQPFCITSMLLALFLVFDADSRIDLTPFYPLVPTLVVVIIFIYLSALIVEGFWQYNKAK